MEAIFLKAMLYEMKKKVSLILFSLIFIICKTNAATLHLFIINGQSDIGATQQLIQERAKLISELTGLFYNPHTYLAKEHTKATLVSYMNQFNCSSDDVIWFYYAGQGRNQRRSSFPMFLCSDSEYLSMDEIRTILALNNPRLFLIMSDTDNYLSESENETLRSKTREFNESATTTSSLAEGLKALFLARNGFINITSNTVGLGAYSYGGREGGIFTNSFVEALMNVAKSANCTWQNVLEETVNMTQRKAISFNKKQVPFYEAKIKYRYSVSKPKVYAVIVGISDYQSIRDLKYCHKDANNMENFLMSSEGGGVPSNQIVKLLNSQATKANVLKMCDKLFRQASENDLIIFYFSGHGSPNAFECYDAPVNHEYLRNIIYNSNAKLKLCVADACYAGTWDKSKESLKNNPASTLYYNALAQAGNGIALFMSARNNETSIDDPYLEEGLFTHFYIEGLKGVADLDYDRIITVQELYDYVKEKVSKRAYQHFQGHSQNPQLKGTFDHNLPVGVRSD